MKYFSNLILIRSKRNDRNMRQGGRNKKRNCVKRTQGIREGPLK
jgi:hypothetical protein